MIKITSGLTFYILKKKYILNYNMGPYGSKTLKRDTVINKCVKN
jgi:hypothetical protein